MTRLSLFLFTTFLSSLSAVETQLTDSEGKKAYLYTPSEKPTEGKIYWLAIGLHGAGGDGKGANGIAAWAGDDVIVLGPSFSQPKPDENAPKIDGPPLDSYQMCGPTHEAKLKSLITEVGKTWKLHPKVFLHGFSAGAQFVHRFAMKNPAMVAGVSAASAGSWSTRGFGEINPEANQIPFAISCGQYDREKSVPSSPLNRLEWMQEFATALEDAHFDVESRVIPNTGHKETADTMALAESCFQRARSVNFSRTVMLASDFNAVNPLWKSSGEARGKGTTALATWTSHAGVIETQGSAGRTGAMWLRVNSAAKTPLWSGTLRTGLLPVHCLESDLAKLTLAFDLSATSARQVRVLIESYNAQHERTGAREGLIVPASPDNYQRHVLDLDTMKPKGKTEFKATDPFVQISLTISNDLGWATGVFHQLRLDNLSYAAPSLYVSPAGDDKNEGGSADKPLATISKALFRARPGDIILLMDGTFESTSTVADFVRAGSPAAWITLKNHPGQKPTLTGTDWNIVKIGRGSGGYISDAPALAYLEVRGLVIRGIADEVEAKYKDDIGKPKGTSNGNGISVDGRYQKQKPHHIRIADNEVVQCAGGGISVIHGDYVQVENNHTHQNCHWMIYAGSGISIYQPFNFDPTTGGHKILVRLNHSHHNYCTQPWEATGKLSDGNGIIVDDTKNYQNKSPNGPYHGGLLVQGNLSHDNGGSGMHSYASDRVDFINNTDVNNNTVMDYGQLSVTRCDHVRVLNNILVAPKDKPLNRVNGDFHDVILSHNLFWGGNGESVPGEQSITADPQFIDASKDDYRLREKSPAKDSAGAWEISPVTGALDRGAPSKAE